MPTEFRRASPFAARANHLRARGGHEHSRVTYVELFFDLVFVFAVTQLSHGLLEHLTPLGALQTARPDARGVVGLDRHRLDHQLARSRSAPRSG